MTRPRLLRYAGRDKRALRLNEPHQRATAHALKIYETRSIYSFIPKNACSTMRLSLAIANGCIADPSDIDWIHANNKTFQATLEDLVMARYTFVILRDPFARLASCFLDKIVAGARPARQLAELTDPQRDLDAISFADFVAALDDEVVRSANMHWRPQTEFLVYDRYDDYFAVERFSAAVEVTRRRAGLEVVDARPFTAHGLDRYALLPPESEHARTTVAEIAALKQAGWCPHPRGLYTAELRDRVAGYYAADLELYGEAIGPSVFFTDGDAG